MILSLFKINANVLLSFAYLSNLFHYPQCKGESKQRPIKMSCSLAQHVICVEVGQRHNSDYRRRRKH